MNAFFERARMRRKDDDETPKTVVKKEAWKLPVMHSPGIKAKFAVTRRAKPAAKVRVVYSTIASWLREATFEEARLLVRSGNLREGEELCLLRKFIS